ncbi:MAG: DHH family phosphoesterase [Lachnospiraceae bacterium]|jgi:c-di-AMP phosphodiesterase-like protein
MKKAKTIKVGTMVKGALIFPVIANAVLLLAAVPAFLMNKEFGYLAAVVFLVHLTATLIFVLVNKRRFAEHLLEFARDYETMEGRMINDFPLPYAITDKNGVIFMYNKRFGRIYDGSPEEGSLFDIFKEMRLSDLEFEGRQNDVAVVYDRRNYRLHFTKLSLSGQMNSKKIVDLSRKDGYVLAVYMIDETEIVTMMQQAVEKQAVICSLTIDDYDEVFEQVDNIRTSLLMAFIDKEIADYFSQVGGLIRKTEKDKYFVMFERKYLALMQRNKFDLLDTIRQIDSDDDVPVTISVGVGVGDSYHQSQDYSRIALELALGRGGDQVVIKEGERTYFYGGKTKSVEKNTRVRARVTALALREVLSSRERVVIMGHKIGDADCFGAAVGISRAAKELGKKAYIVLNELGNSVQPILEDFLDSEDYGEEAFVSANDAAKYVDEDTALVIVDVNRPEIFECPDLIHKTKTIIMIDHHLQSGDRIDNVVLSYVEPSASSASEMVTELLQYIAGDIRLTKLEAEALYAGILIDTDGFTKNTGVKTFEAAAYLRKNGVDINRVNGMFSDTLQDFKLKAETIKTAEIFADGFAIAVSPTEGVENPTIVAAQVANELLTISGIRASFVMVDFSGDIHISARSKGNLNVQLIMERMGGGGHMNVAGAQLKNSSIEEAEKKLKLIIRKMIEEGILQ